MLIDRDEVIKAIKQYGKSAIDEGRKGLDTVDNIVELVRKIQDIPTADVVPVVRCEKCKHCLLDLSGREAHLCMYKRKSLLNARVKRDDFCSYGERENNGICKED